VPYRVEIVLTDNGVQFADLPKNRSRPTARFRGLLSNASVVSTGSNIG